jgi:hypothetical protein
MSSCWFWRFSLSVKIISSLTLLWVLFYITFVVHSRL